VDEARMPADVYLNQIATAVPEHEVHEFFLQFAASLLANHPRRCAIFERMAASSGIDHRYSCYAPADDPLGKSVDKDGVWRRGSLFSTRQRMEMFEAAAPILARTAVDRLQLGTDCSRISHLIVTTCTGLSAPGIDLELVSRCGLPISVERTMIGFMGCYAAISALKLARHIVRSEPQARVLIVNIELCTLHLRETHDLEKLLSFCLWSDGCAASLVTAEPSGLLLDSFHASVAFDHREFMSWSIGDDGFHMVLSGRVPAAISEALRTGRDDIMQGRAIKDIGIWAVHPGGRSVLDAVERAFELDPAALAGSREVLRRNGNMSSATVMFVLEKTLKAPAGLVGCGMAFGPGLTAETMMFRTV
jgi:predicted naringenin-chalcone synthase